MQSIKHSLQRVKNRGAVAYSVVGPDFKLPEDGMVPIAAFGEHPIQDDDASIQGIQVVDKVAVEAMVKNRGTKEFLIDYDHESHDLEKRTEAAGWAQPKMEIREDGLYTDVRWSKNGREDVEGGNYRYISPEFLGFEEIGPGRYRPLALVGGGLTNRTAMVGQKPVTNRGKGENQTMDHKNTLCDVLGLPADASDETISSRATTFKGEVVKNRAAAGRVPDLEANANRVAELEAVVKAQNEELAEADLEKYAPLIKNRAKWKEMLVKNRAGTVELLESLEAPEEAESQEIPASKQTVFNRGSVKGPSNGLKKANAEHDLRAKRVHNRARELRSNNPKLSVSAAFRQAEDEYDVK